MSWTTIEFGKLYAEPSRNGVYKSREHHGSGTKIVNMGELFAHDTIGGQEMQRLRMSDAEMSKAGLAEGDLLFGRRSLVEAGAGKCSIVEGLVEQTTFESSIIRVRVNQSLIRSRFLYYWLKSPAGRGRVRAIVTGTNVKGIRGSVLQTIQVPCPPLATQDNVVSALRAYDDLIENNRRRMALLEQAARLLYKEWFVHLRFPGHEHVKINDGVPEGWEKRPLGNVASIVMGNSPNGDTYNETGDGMPLINGPVEFGERFTKRVKWTTKPTRVCQENDLIVCVRGSTTGKNVKSDGEYCLGRGVCAISSREQTFVDESFRANVSALLLLTTGATFPSWSGPSLRSFQILWPPTSLREFFEFHSAPMASQLRGLHEQNERLSKARDLLLPRLMNGEIPA